MSDISTKDDIEKLMTLFYDRLLDNPIAAPIFSGTDMEKHMPRVIAFWDGIAFGGGTYRGVPFDPHVPLDLKSEHFVIWFETFCGTLDDLFEGPIVAKLKERARSIAFIFSHKLGLEAPEI